jgi:hypothetical protein
VLVELEQDHVRLADLRGEVLVQPTIEELAWSLRGNRTGRTA